MYNKAMEQNKNAANQNKMPWWRRRKKHPQPTDQPKQHAAPVKKEQLIKKPATPEPRPQPQHLRRVQNNQTQQALPKKPVVYAFIDSQNLNLGVQKQGWKMDWHKLRAWLRDKYGVTHAYMFIGYMSENEDMYHQMHEHGFLVVLKPTNEIMIVAKPDETPKEEKVPVKGNIDADLVLHAMKELPHYDKAIIVSNDGDFYGLIEYLAQQNKLLHVMTPSHRYSMLLKPFEKYLVNLDQHRRELRYYSRVK